MALVTHVNVSYGTYDNDSVMARYDSLWHMSCYGTYDIAYGTS